jgi:hypothetical protein
MAAGAFLDTLNAGSGLEVLVETGIDGIGTDPPNS